MFFTLFRNKRTDDIDSYGLNLFVRELIVIKFFSYVKMHTKLVD